MTGFIALFAIGNTITSGAETAFGETDISALDTSPPQVLDIDDPFSRDLKRAADDATGGLIFDGNELNFTAEEKTGKDLLGQESQIAVIASRFRVLGLVLSRPAHKSAIYSGSVDGNQLGEKPLRPYIRVGHHPSEAPARQQALNLLTTFSDYIDMSFILNPSDEGKGTDLGLGPFRSIDHAEGFCDLLVDVTEGLVTGCQAILRYPGEEPEHRFTSTAIMRLSPETVANVLEDTVVFDLAAAADQTITIREGETIGSEGAVVVKIIPSGIMLVDQVGNIAKLPTSYIPEGTFQARESATGLTSSLDEIKPGFGTENLPLPGATDQPAPTAADYLIDQN